MAENRTSAQQDRSKVSIDDESALSYWSRELGATKEQLEDALRAVGPSPTDIRAYLNQPAEGAGGG